MREESTDPLRVNNGLGLQKGECMPRLAPTELLSDERGLNCMPIFPVSPSARRTTRVHRTAAGHVASGKARERERGRGSREQQI